MKSAFLRTAATLALALAFAASAGADQPVPTLAPAPMWKLKDLDGNVVNSYQFKGKVMVLDFWATWCAPCKAEIPGYIALQKKYGAEGLVVVGVSKDDDTPKRLATVRDFAASHGMNYTIVFTDDNIEDALGGIDAIPTTYIIDREGRIRSKKVGAEAPADFEKKVLAVLRPAG
jgi:thiol-disulfide isomerase/thioredoxin